MELVMNKIFTPEIIKLACDVRACWEIIDNIGSVLSKEEYAKVDKEWWSMRELLITLIKENCDAN